MHAEKKTTKGGRKTPSPSPLLYAFTYRRGGYRIGNIRRISIERRTEENVGFSLLVAVLGEKKELDGWKMEEREREGEAYGRDRDA